MAIETLATLLERERERERELAELENAQTEALQGHGQVILVEATAGLGKTSLLWAASQRAAEAGFTCLQARATPTPVDLLVGSGPARGPARLGRECASSAHARTRVIEKARGSPPPPKCLSGRGLDAGVSGGPASLHAGPPTAIAALRVLQVWHEDLAEEAEAAQEIGMWPM